MIDIDNEIIDGYIGGEIVVINFDARTIHRGPIETIEMHDDTLNVNCLWMAKSGSYPEAGDWLLSDRLSHQIELCIHDAVLPGLGRLNLQSLATQEIIVLFGRGDESRLDPTKVANFAQAT